MRSPPPPKRAPTLEDVAQEANVSTATVSRVLNKPDEVREALKARVEAAIRRLGYVQNAGARALVVGSQTIGAIFPTIDHAIFAKGIDALQRRLESAGLQLLIATSDYDADLEDRRARNLVLHGAQGLALCGCEQNASLLEFIRQRGLPTVHVLVSPGPAGMQCIGFDNVAAMLPAVQYLIDIGHKQIGMLAGITAHNDRAAARVAGVRLAMKRAGLPLPPERIVERPYDLAAARDGLRALLRTPHPPTAVLCGNDVLAEGALLEALAIGMQVPGDLSIVGFDDLEVSKHMVPPLTTVHVPTARMWQMAADRLVALIRKDVPPEAGALETPLIVRGSTGPPKTQK